ncbi:hypothetical protein PF006_g25990 [Phytophthora fragariae]|uniref:Uncharacterized protein n=1 Tax=Phytophthora fragariae TaxID=53985 RepID=A0A6A3R0I7_9STRA|nr:hypothetical protein PF006_g25990 [Phytophthora fragariae]
MPPKRSVRSAKAPSKPRAVGPKTRAAKAKHDSSALKEATETAEEAVRSCGSTPEGERRSRSRSKTPETAPGKGGEPSATVGAAQAALRLDGQPRELHAGCAFW